MKYRVRSLLVLCALLAATPMLAQDGEGGGGDGEIIVTAQRMESKAPAKMTSLPYLERRPLVGLRRPADGVVRHIEITSDSLEQHVRRKEVEAMLLSALDRAKREGLSLVTGTLEVKEVTRENWRIVFPALAAGALDDEAEDEDDEDDDEDEEENGRVQPGFEDDGSTATVRLMVKTRLTGTIADAQKKISAFAKGVPTSGRAQIHQKGIMALTIINPEQYRDEIYSRIAKASQHAASFYGEGYKVEVAGLDREIAWAQVSNTEVFLYIPYSFVVSK
jgi:hypothetical protein